MNPILSILLIVTICSGICSSAVAPTPIPPQVTFTTNPNEYHVGTPFVAKCSIANVDLAKLFRYTVTFRFNAEKEKLIDYGQNASIGYYHAVGSK